MLRKRLVADITYLYTPLLYNFKKSPKRGKIQDIYYFKDNITDKLYNLLINIVYQFVCSYEDERFFINLPNGKSIRITNVMKHFPELLSVWDDDTERYKTAKTNIRENSYLLNILEELDYIRYHRHYTESKLKTFIYFNSSKLEGIENEVIEEIIKQRQKKEHFSIISTNSSTVNRQMDDFKHLQINELGAINLIEDMLKNKAKLKPKAKKVNDYYIFLNNRRMTSFIAVNYRLKVLAFNRFKFFVEAKTGRHITSFTNLPKPLRKFVYDSRDQFARLSSADVECAQPKLLSKIINDDNYSRDVYSNDIYTLLGNKAGIDCRDEAKVKSYIEIFFGLKPDQKHFGKMLKAFISLYPSAYTQLKKLAKYHSIASLLQKEESKRMLQVCEEMHHKGITCFTIHDEIFVETKYLGLLKDAMNKHF